MKVIIAGSRSFKDYGLLREKCDFLLSNLSDIVIVSGNAKGADLLGEMYAKEKCYGLKIFPADWDKYKKAAGYIRNTEMAKYSDALIAFWDGFSRGTKHMIDIAKEQGLKVRVVRI